MTEPLTMSAERLDEIRTDLRSPCSHFPRSRPDLLLAELDATRAKLAEAEAEMSGLRLAALEVIVHWDFKMTCEDDKMESLIHDLRLAVDPLMRPDAAPTPEVSNE